MCKVKISLCIILFMSFAFALDFPLTTNVDADVVFKGGGQTHNVTTVGGVEQIVSISWITAQMNVEISVSSKNIRYKDSTFTTSMGSNAATYPAWNAGTQYNQGDKVSHGGQNWQCGWWSQGDAPGGASPSPWTVIQGEQTPPITIILNQKPLPTDSAFVPIYSNRDVEIDISSGVANGTVTLNGRVRGCILALPLEGGGLTINNENLVCDGSPSSPTAIGGKKISGGASAAKKVSSEKLVSQRGYHLLSLSQNRYKNGEIRIISTNGKIISANKLSGINQTSVTVSGVAAGVYLLNAKGINGANFTSKIFHKGGDLRIAASFGEQFEVGGLVNSKIVRADEQKTELKASRAGNVTYTLTARNQTLGNQTKSITASGGMNSLVEILFEDPNALPSEKFSELVSEATYKEMFPNRYGFGRAECANADASPNCSQGKSPTGAGDGDYDFFTYNSLLEAIDLLGEVEVDLEYATDNAGKPMWGAYKINWENKKTGVKRVLQTPEFGKWTRTVNLGKIDYADFCNAGSLSARKQELAAFLGNISHETTGYGYLDPNKVWGLYWREETAWQTNPNAGLGYTDGDPGGYFNPAPNKSYHGRGPIQISYAYNYGQFSEFLYGDKNVLINNPDALCPKKPEDATLAFASAIWFWMTPQPPKISCHQVYREDFTPSAEDIAKGRNRSKFGWTVSIINGGLECGFSNTAGDYRVADRIGFYQRYIRMLGEQPEADCGCDFMNY